MSGLLESLCDPARPTFTIGACPPREGTTEEQAKEAAGKFGGNNFLLVKRLHTWKLNPLEVIF